MSITLESIVPVQADRDELQQLLNLLNTHWHQNEEAFASRSLAEWPQWCADQGFRFALLKDLARNLGSTLTYPEGCPGLDQLITALGPAATTAQLLDSLDQDLPQFLEGFDQLLQISQEETAALGAQAGGSGKGAEWMKDHPWLDAGVGATAIGVSSFVIYLKWRAKQAAKRRMLQEQQIAKDRVNADTPKIELFADGDDPAMIYNMRVFHSTAPKAEELKKEARGRVGAYTDNRFPGGIDQMVTKDVNKKLRYTTGNVVKSDKDKVNAEVSDDITSKLIEADQGLVDKARQELINTVDAAKEKEQAAIRKEIDKVFDNEVAQVESDAVSIFESDINIIEEIEK